MQKTIKNIIAEAMKEFDITEDVAIAIFESPYKCARTRIAEATEGELDTFVNVRFKKLGILAADHRKIKAIENARNGRGNKDNEEQ